MKRISMLVLGVALATLFFAFLVLTTRADYAYDTVGDTTLEDFNAGELFHTGLTRSTAGGGDGDGEVRLLTVGIAGKWYTETNHTGLPGLFGHAAVQHNGYLYVIGGRTATGYTSHVYYARILTETHDLADWQETTSLSSTNVYTNGVYNHGAAVVNGRIYVLGGRRGATLFDTVCHAPINEDGTLGAWSATTPLSQAINLVRVVVVHDRLYVLGGQRAAAPSALDTVYYVKPHSATGVITPGAWATTTALPRPMYGHMVAIWDNRIYVAGGKAAGNTFYPYVNYAAPVTSTGAITAGGWMTGTNMKNNLYGGAAVAVFGELFTTGGGINSNTDPSGYVGAALIDRYGGVGTWVDTQFIIPERFYHATVTSDDGWIYVIGGSADGTNPITDTPINRGATAGGGKSFAPDGNFMSRVFDLGQNHVVTELSWSTFISDTTAVSITMRYRLRPAGGVWGAWSPSYPSASQTGSVTTTVPISISARYLQYAAVFSTTVSNWTPVLNRAWFTYILPNPDLELTKDDTPDVAHLGDVITYTLYYTNTGGKAKNTYITETVPAYTTAGANPDWENLGGGRYRYHLGPVESQTFGQVQFVVQVHAQVPDGTASIYDEALIEPKGQPDSNPDDNRAQLYTPLEWVDLRLSLSDGVTIARPGDMLTYTATITNAGSVTATGCMLTMTIPAHTASYGNPDWTPAGGLQYTRSFDNIAPGSLPVTFTVLVDDPVDPSVTSLEATATVTDDGTHGPDPVPGDNTDSDVDVLSWVDLAVDKTDGYDLAFRNQTLVYTITITNTGNATINGTLYLTDTLPLNTTYVNQGDGWSGSDRTWTKSVPIVLAPDTSTTMHIAARTTAAAPAGPLTNTVTAWTLGDLHPDSSTAHDVDTLITDAPNLVVEISDGATTTRLCQVQNYTVQYHNDGDETANNVVLTATLPAGVTYLGTGWQAIGGGRYTYAVAGSVNSGQGGTVALSTVLTTPVSLSQVSGVGRDRASSGDFVSRSPDDWPYKIVQSVRIGCSGPENPEGNEDSDENDLLRPDLYIASVTYTPAQPRAGQTVTFNVVIGNEGDTPVANNCCHNFAVDLYVNPPHPPGEGEYSNVGVDEWPADVSAHGTVPVPLYYAFPSEGTYTVYVQVNADRYWGIPESDFTNNTSNAVVVNVGPPRLYLPLIVKSFRQ